MYIYIYIYILFIIRVDDKGGNNHLGEHRQTMPRKWVTRPHRTLEKSWWENQPIYEWTNKKALKATEKNNLKNFETHHPDDNQLDIIAGRWQGVVMKIRKRLSWGQDKRVCKSGKLWAGMMCSWQRRNTHLLPGCVYKPLLFVFSALVAWMMFSLLGTWRHH